MQVEKISFQNYKAFKEGEIEIKPITVLLGANAIGKTSIMQLLSILHQTSIQETTDSDILRLNGGMVSIGEPINLFNNRNEANLLSFEIQFEDFDFIKSIRKRLVEDFVEDWETKALKHILNNNELIISKKTLTWIKSEIPMILDDFGYTQDDFLSLYGGRSRRKGIGSNRKKIATLPLIKNNFDDKKYTESIDLFEKISKIVEGAKFSVQFKIKYKEEKLELFEVKIFNNSNEIISYTFEQNYTLKGVSILGEVQNLDVNTLIDVEFSILKSKNIFSEINEDKVKFSNKSQLLIAIIFYNQAVKSLKNCFKPQSFNYVGPLRAYPKRYYVLDKRRNETFFDTLDGEALAERLKDDLELREVINRWLKRFDIQIDISKVRDIIHSFNVKQGSLDLNLTDIGFGISQILPVIAQGFLAIENSITLIEQPEIHLHPKMQADLADLFIDMVSENIGKKKLIIETHSEYLLKRLRRRIIKGDIMSKDVKIYSIERSSSEKNCAEIKEMNIDDKIGFKFPNDFYTNDLIDDIFTIN